MPRDEFKLELQLVVHLGLMDWPRLPKIRIGLSGLVMGGRMYVHIFDNHGGVREREQRQNGTEMKLTLTGVGRGRRMGSMLLYILCHIIN